MLENIYKFLTSLLVDKTERVIDVERRNAIVNRYQLLELDLHQTTILVSLEEFFEGNNDQGSFGVNLEHQPPISVFYYTLKKIKAGVGVIDILVNIRDVNIYENGQLDDNEWFYSDTIYIIGKLDLESIRSSIQKIQPYEVFVLEDKEQIKCIVKKNASYQNQKIIVLYWD